VGEDFSSWCRGKVIFVGGSEVAVIDEPRLLEVVRTDQVASLAHVLEAVTGRVAGARRSPAGEQRRQQPPGRTDLRRAGGRRSPAGGRALVRHGHRPPGAGGRRHRHPRRPGVTCTTVEVGDVPSGFAGAADALASAAERVGPLDGVVVALAGPSPAAGSTSAWEQVLAEHAGLVEGIHADAGWTRAVADYSGGADRPVRLVTLTDSVTAGGAVGPRRRRSSPGRPRRATGDRVAAFAVSVEEPAASSAPSIGELVAHLLCSPEAPALSGAELVAGPGWIGLRSHPRPSGSITFGGPAIPDWLDGTLQSIAAPMAKEGG